MSEDDSMPFTIDESLLRECVQPSDDGPARARYGRPGACAACKQSVLSHFDTVGRFIGCTAVSDGTVFVLVPVCVSDTSQDGTTARKREFQRARYRATDNAINAGELSDHRRRVLDAVLEAGAAGTRTKDIIKRSGLPNSSVSQALSWLREEGLVDAEEDAAGITDEADV